MVMQNKKRKTLERGTDASGARKMVATAEARAAETPYISTAEAARILDVRRPYVTSLIRDGKLAAMRLSPRVYIIQRDSVRRYLREHRNVRMGAPRHDGSDFRG